MINKKPSVLWKITFKRTYLSKKDILSPKRNSVFTLYVKTILNRFIYLVFHMRNPFLTEPDHESNEKRDKTKYQSQGLHWPCLKHGYNDRDGLFKSSCGVKQRWGAWCAQEQVGKFSAIPSAEVSIRLSMLSQTVLINYIHSARHDLEDYAAKHH